MVVREDVATVQLWGENVGAIVWDRDRELGIFEFETTFLRKNIRLSPYIIRQDAPGVISFPALNKDTYKGLPGFLADTLPDDFGNAVIDAWLARRGRSLSEFSPVQRLCYTGSRGMGALEFKPALPRNLTKNTHLEINELVELASLVSKDRHAFVTMLGKSDSEKENAISSIISVGTSAGGQRPKAVLAIHPVTKRIVSGQIKAPKGYEHWLLKFDGMQSGVSSGAGVRTDPQGFGIVEYAYHMMAKACGITMMECQLLTENGRSHFMTRRFDRTPDGEKIHFLSLCGMAHFDYRKAGYYSYEQLFDVMRTIHLPHSDAVEQYRRMAFNVVARNQDDHTKNIAFILDNKGVWRLSPAFDLTYSHNPKGEWTSKHQMTLAGKRDHFTKDDLLHIGKSISIPKPSEIIDEIVATVAEFKKFAEIAGLDKKKTKAIETELRLKW